MTTKNANGHRILLVRLGEQTSMSPLCSDYPEVLSRTNKENLLYMYYHRFQFYATIGGFSSEEIMFRLPSIIPYMTSRQNFSCRS